MPHTTHILGLRWFQGSCRNWQLPSTSCLDSSPPPGLHPPVFGRGEGQGLPILELRGNQFLGAAGLGGPVRAALRGYWLTGSSSFGGTHTLSPRRRLCFWNLSCSLTAFPASELNICRAGAIESEGGHLPSTWDLGLILSTPHHPVPEPTRNHRHVWQIKK